MSDISGLILYGNAGAHVTITFLDGRSPVEMDVSEEEAKATFRPGSFKHLVTPPEHVLLFVNNSATTAFVAYSHAVKVDLRREGQPLPGAAWKTDGRGGAAKRTTFDEIATEAAERVVEASRCSQS